MIRIALDAMGGDHGPAAIVDGALRAIERGYATAEQLLLVGVEAEVRRALAERQVDDGRFRIVDAPDVLVGDEAPVEAMRRKPRNSIAVGAGLVKAQDADAFLSAGNTGLVVASAMMQLKCLEGIRRPGIAVTINGEKGPFVLIDVGANPQPKALHLLHYALMGSAYAHDAFGIEKPRVGLMNIGSEDQKGNPLVREARDLLRAGSPNYSFVGNVEGVDVFSGRCDVIVSDGFTGNVLLKVSEGVAEFMLRMLGRVLGEAELPEELVQKLTVRMQRDADYSEYGGALLLGVEGIVTICHGRSQGRAISNAIRFASRAVGAKVNDHIIQAARSAAAIT